MLVLYEGFLLISLELFSGIYNSLIHVAWHEVQVLAWVGLNMVFFKKMV